MLTWPPKPFYECESGSANELGGVKSDSEHTRARIAARMGPPSAASVMEVSAMSAGSESRSPSMTELRSRRRQRTKFQTAPSKLTETR